ncbi:DUF1840 domain-containing protein [Legionella waltersii]|uniref:DUF1840 domain-containing protein n=1 Tax=Legionella waltersii TaxID=66969 RepID=A0A0W1ACY0_9GAMM|nr:DUF1840 domain-containing protein [Legionella waltersii]KTD79228.1 hypothetical protein Lwal_1300 [Legionella waltersii]SNV12630.1 Domain of uncharacterised function (DUF1840) [Legionella waltersii]
MFVTFKCDAYENISYFNDIAKQLLSLIGHGGSIPGAIKSEDIATALESLQQGLGKIKAVNQSRDDEEQEQEISLAKRAMPLIQLMQAALKKDCDILWEYSKFPG